MTCACGSHGGRRRDAVTVPRGRRHPAAAPRPPALPATGAAREAIVSEVAAVDDDELRELIARVRITPITEPAPRRRPRYFAAPEAPGRRP